jgi:hypothetical protein
MCLPAALGSHATVFCVSRPYGMHALHCTQVAAFVCRVSVSSNGRYIAAADGSGQVLLYGFLPYKGTFLKWDLVGKFRAHHSKCSMHYRTQQSAS